MYVIEILISGLVGAALGYIFNELVDSFKKKRRKRKYDKRNTNLSEELKKGVYTVDENGIITLAHGTPSYCPGLIKGFITDKMFYYPIPTTDSIDEKLSKFGFNQDSSVNQDFKYTEEVNCLSNSFWGKESFNKGLKTFGNYSWDKKVKEELAIIAIDVAKQFLSDLEAGLVRFNGAMFGVSSFHPNRTIGEELPNADIYFYKTDYYTYRVFSQFYINHRDEFIKTKITNETINHNLAYPFLTSFGISVIAVLSSNNIEEKISDSDILIIGQRSKKVIVDKGLFHFTMNEAFSCRDTIYNNPSFDLCVSRGFNEELKWTKDIKGLSISNCKFMDFFFDSNKCEMGLTGYIKMSIDESLSPQKLMELYLESQDGILETEGLKPVMMKDAHAFYRENKDKMSAAFATELKLFLRRYDNDLL